MNVNLVAQAYESSRLPSTLISALPAVPQVPERASVARLAKQFEQFAIANASVKMPIVRAKKSSLTPVSPQSGSLALAPTSPLASLRAPKSPKQAFLGPPLQRSASLSPPVSQAGSPRKLKSLESLMRIGSLKKESLDLLSRLQISETEPILGLIAQFALEGSDSTYFEKSSLFCLNRQLKKRLEKVMLNIYRGSGAIGNVLFQYIFTNRRVLNLHHYLTTTPTLGETLGDNLRLSRHKAWLNETTASITHFRCDDFPKSAVQKATDSEIEIISRFSKLVDLALPNTSLSEVQLIRLHALPLTCLDVACDNEGVLAIAKMANLYRLRIFDYNQSISDDAINYLPLVKNLRHLSLQNCRNSTNTAMSTLATMPLESLSLIECPVTSLGMRILGQIDSLQTLVIRIYETVPLIHEPAFCLELDSFSMVLPEEDSSRYKVMQNLKKERPELTIDLQQTYHCDGQIGDHEEVTEASCCGEWDSRTFCAAGDSHCCIIL